MFFFLYIFPGVNNFYLLLVKYKEQTDWKTIGLQTDRNKIPVSLRDKEYLKNFYFKMQ